MITLEKYRKQLSEFYEYLLDKFFKKELLIPDQLTLSAIGARICYSTAPDFAELLRDPRISKETEKFAFLKRLYEAKHDSVFAHSPILFAEKDRFQKFNVFKLWQFYESSVTHFCASARHLVEAMRYRNLDFDTLATSVKKQTPFSLKYTSEREGSREIIVIRLPETKPWWWTSVIAFGVSRVMTHQFVRHTWLNFSQRSHRYTPVDGYAFPETITRKPFLKEISEEVIEFFKKLKEKNSRRREKGKSQIFLPPWCADNNNGLRFSFCLGTLHQC